MATFNSVCQEIPCFISDSPLIYQLTCFPSSSSSLVFIIYSYSYQFPSHWFWISCRSENKGSNWISRSVQFCIKCRIQSFQSSISCRRPSEHRMHYMHHTIVQKSYTVNMLWFVTLGKAFFSYNEPLPLHCKARRFQGELNMRVLFWILWQAMHWE